MRVLNFGLQTGGPMVIFSILAAHIYVNSAHRSELFVGVYGERK